MSSKEGCDLERLGDLLSDVIVCGEALVPALHVPPDLRFCGKTCTSNALVSCLYAFVGNRRVACEFARGKEEWNEHA